MKKILAFLVSAAMLLLLCPAGMLSAGAQTGETDAFSVLMAFDESCAWKGVGAQVDFSSGNLVMVNEGYGTVESGGGFVRNLTTDGLPQSEENAADCIRIYAKNEGETAVSLYVQFSDGEGNYWWKESSIPGNTLTLQPFDYPLDAFTYRYNSGGPGNLVEPGTTWAAAKAADKLTAAQYATNTFNLTFNSGTAGLTLTVSKLYAVKRAATDGDEAAHVLDFSERLDWSSFLSSVAYRDGGIAFVDVQQYGGADSRRGRFVNLTADGQTPNGNNAADRLRLYIKNPGNAVTLRFQYMDAHTVVRMKDMAIAGGSAQYVPYDFPLMEFTTPNYAQTDNDGKTHAPDTALKDDEAADHMAGSAYCLTFVFLSTPTEALYISDLQGIRAKEQEPETITKDGEPEHAMDYDPLEDFESYTDNAQMQTAWVRDAGSSEGAGFQLIQTTDGGKAGYFTADAGGKNAIYQMQFPADEARAQYDRIRIWAKGSGRLTLQLNMNIPPQHDGTSMVSFLKSVPVTAEGGASVLSLKTFELPSYWEDLGYDSFELDPSKITGIFLVHMSSEKTELVVDNIGFVEKEAPEELEIRDGEPAHTVYYDPLEDFESYTDNAQMQTAWVRDAGSSEGAGFQLVQTTDGGKAGYFTADAGGKNAIYQMQFPADEARAQYDRIRVWTKGNGRLALQLNMDIPPQHDGTSMVSFLKFIPVTEEGGASVFSLSGFELPNYWQGMGYDTFELDPSKITGIFLVCMTSEETELVIDNIGFVKKGAVIVDGKELEVKEGEPEHEVYYDPLEDFEGYANQSEMAEKWEDCGSSSGAGFYLVKTPLDTKAGNFVIDAADKSATYQFKFPADAGRAQYDRIRLWAKGNGRLALQLNMDIPPQHDGTSMVSFLKFVPLYEEGAAYLFNFSDFELPSYWLGNGYEVFKPDPAKINGIFLVCMSSEPTDVVVDNIGFVKAGVDPDKKPEVPKEEYTQVIDNFNGYADDAALGAVWKPAGQTADSAKLSIRLAEDAQEGKLLSIAADGVTAVVADTAVSRRQPMDWRQFHTLRLYARGNGESVQIRVTSISAQDGQTSIPFVYTFAAPSAGKTIDVPLSELLLPSWWTEENGYNSDETIQLDKIVGFELQVAGANGSVVAIDDIVLVSDAPIQPGRPGDVPLLPDASDTQPTPNPGTGAAVRPCLMMIPVLCVAILAGLGFKKKTRSL